MLFAIGGEGPLNCDRAEQRAPRAGERDHKAVTHGFDFVALVERDLLADDRVMCTQNFLRAQIAETLEQRRRAFHVGEKDSRGTIRRRNSTQVAKLSYRG